MEGNNLVVLVLTLILGGGLAAAILNIVRARVEAKKAPVDRDAVIVTSAESAVAIMQKVLDTTSRELSETGKRLERREAEIKSLRQRVDHLEGELTNVRIRCNELEELLHTITTGGVEETPQVPNPTWGGGRHGMPPQR